MEKLKAQLNELTTSLQVALEANTSIVSKNKELKPKLAQAKIDGDSYGVFGLGRSFEKLDMLCLD